MSAVFFPPCPPAARAPHAAGRHLLIEQLVPPARHGMRIQVEKRRQDRIAPVAESHRFHAGEQPPLLFIEQAVEQQDGGFEFIGGHLQRGGVRDHRDGVSRAAVADLILRASRLGGRVKKSIHHLGPAQATLPNEVVKRILHGDMQRLGKFIGEPPLRRPGDPRFKGGHECPMSREPHVLVRPEPVLVKASDLSQRIKASTMSVAGEVIQLPEFAEDGERSGRPQHLFQRRQIADSMTPQIGAQDLRFKGCGAHNVRVPTLGSL